MLNRAGDLMRPIRGKGNISSRRQCATQCITKESQHVIASRCVSDTTPWPKKSSLFLLRTDGKSCSRELVTGAGSLTLAYPSTQQHLMVWRRRPKTVLVLKKLGDQLLPELMDVIRFLAMERGLRVLLEPLMYKEHFSCPSKLPAHDAVLLNMVYTWDDGIGGKLGDKVDFVVALGGDGVILHAGSLFQLSSMPPIIAFNLGSLGFLTNHYHSEMKESLDGVIYGSSSLSQDLSDMAEFDLCNMDDDLDWPSSSPSSSSSFSGLDTHDTTKSSDCSDNRLGVMITLRMRLKCEIYRSRHSQPEQSYHVMNEVVCDRGPNAFLSNIEVWEKGRFITRVQADGIMLSTPTGSTAYSVSAGGSMVHPNVPSILLTPICPHSLSFRPILLPDYAEIELRIPEDARCTAWVCFDGRSRQELHRGDSIHVKMSDSPMPTINKNDLTGDWFESLERCFRWSDRVSQKKE